MLIRDIFSQGCWILVFIGLSWTVAAQREDIKFGLPQLDTALTMWTTDEINSGGAQFSPTYFRDGILFVSGKEAHPLDYEEGNVFYRIQYAPLSAEGEVQAAIPFPLTESHRGHLGPVAYVDSLNTLFISRSDTQDPSTKYTKSGAQMHIFQTTWKDSVWQETKDLSINDSLANSFHPTLSDDGTLLIFSSDRSGENGRYNLYASEWIDGQWSTPYGLPRINSKANEAFPCLYQNKYLFFSSDRKGGVGNYDFYLSVRRPSGWSVPINLGSPFNSEKDDIGIAFHSNGKDGFLSSNREGSDNIYGFSSSLHLFKEELPDREIEIIAVNNETGMRLGDVKMWLFHRSPTGDIANPDLYQTSIVEENNTQGLTIAVNRKSAAALNDPTAVTNRNGKTVLELSPEQPLRTLVAYKKGFVELEVPLDYFRTDSSVQLLFDELTCVPLEIRAVGVEGKRVQQFDVFIRNLSDNQLQEFSLPLTERICIEHNKEYEIIARKEGAISDTFQIDPQQDDVKKVAVLFRLLPEIIAETRDFATTEIDDLKEGVTVELRNIYYDFDRASIREGAEEELVRLADIMREFPAMEIELAAHTDSRGKASYNLKLSQRRAEEAKRVLVREGVESHRIQPRGYGATQLKNHCSSKVSCTEDEHQENRRTEIRILKAPQQMQIEYAPSKQR